MKSNLPFLLCVCIAGLLSLGSFTGSASGLQSVGNPTLTATQRMLESVRAERERLDQKKLDLQQQLQETKKALQVSEQKLVDAEQKLRENNLSSAAVHDVLLALQTSRIQLMIDLAGLRARQEQLRVMGQERNKEADALHQIQVQVAQEQMELANQQMQRVEALYEKGSTTSHELQLAKHQVNLARLRLLETEASKSSLNSSADELTIALDLAEKEARLAKTESLLNTTVKARDFAEQADQGRMSRQELQEISKQLDASLRQLQNDQVRIAETISKLEAELSELDKDK